MSRYENDNSHTDNNGDAGQPRKQTENYKQGTKEFRKYYERKRNRRTEAGEIHKTVP